MIQRKQLFRSCSRSNLGNRATIQWLHTRYTSSSNLSRRNQKYLFQPLQLKRQKKIQQIFKDFDIDKSGGLSIKQMYQAFNKYGIQILYQQVQQLFKIADVKQFTIDSFKKFSLNNHCNTKFSEIIKKIDNRKHHQYLPHTIIRMFTYLVYKIKSQQILKKLQKSRNANDSYQYLLRLIELPDLKMNNQLVRQQRRKVHDNIRKKLSQIYDKALQKYKYRRQDKYQQALQYKKIVIDKMCCKLQQN